MESASCVSWHSQFFVWHLFWRQAKVVDAVCAFDRRSPIADVVSATNQSVVKLWLANCESKFISNRFQFIFGSLEGANNDERSEIKRQITITGGSSYSSSSSRITTIITMVLHTILRLIALVTVGVVCYACFTGGTTLMSWHPSLMSIGVSHNHNWFQSPISFDLTSIFPLQFLLLMTEAILTFSSNSYLARNMKHVERMTVHGALQFAAIACFTIAFVSVYNHKIHINRVHFETWHAILGLTTCILVLGTAVGGILARYSFIISRIVRPVYMKIIHSSFGVVTYLLAMTVICLGFDTKWFRGRINESLISLLITLAAISAVLIVLQPLVKIIKRVRDRM